jgi:hypothetical protein|tara:strand:- start:86 stop:193 length:108 start_codon:yes stop_codon:yes gene_type:complete
VDIKEAKQPGSKRKAGAEKIKQPNPNQHADLPENE